VPRTTSSVSSGETRSAIDFAIVKRRKVGPWVMAIGYIVSRKQIQQKRKKKLWLPPAPILPGERVDGDNDNNKSNGKNRSARRDTVARIRVKHHQL